MRWILFFVLALGLGVVVARRTAEHWAQVESDGGAVPIASGWGDLRWYGLLYGAGAVFYGVARAYARPEPRPLTEVEKG